MTFLEAIILAVIQGIAEYLPVSSTGHLAILNSLIDPSGALSDHLLFDAVLHLGSLAAVCVIYRKDIAKMFKSTLQLIRGDIELTSYGNPSAGSARQLLFIMIATVPMLIVLLLNKFAVKLFSMLGFVGFAFIVNGVILYVTTRYIKPGVKKSNDMTYIDALIIGVSQACSSLPGISRTGITANVGMARGLTKSYSVKFSMLLAIPVMLGTFIIRFVGALSAGIGRGMLPMCLIGFVISGLFSFLSIRLFNLVFRKRKGDYIAYYCIGVGLLALILSFI